MHAALKYFAAYMWLLSNAGVTQAAHWRSIPSVLLQHRSVGHRQQAYVPHRSICQQRLQLRQYQVGLTVAATSRLTR